MIPLSLNCHRCDQPFPSGTCRARKGARGIGIEGIVYQCPHCRTRDTYTTEELYPADPESAPTPPTYFGGWRARLSPSGRSLAGSGLWLGVVLGVLLAVVATGMVHVVHAGVLSLGL